MIVKQTRYGKLTENGDFVEMSWDEIDKDFEENGVETTMEEIRAEKNLNFRHNSLYSYDRPK